ncbi:CAP-Gly domain-containing protein [Meloidogyne graminicola]|uniref:Tubulin-specific chaperone E n=1 Tax=Meloidogyne graminicola TaxID=189291 RepID=A0A8S9ZWU4_9BILA|nr:CAP-Gly domain-containing protein [Meloidogyne graminicola]
MVELNKRILLNNSKGVVKYYGEVEGTNGVWVGVDWDDKYRGKHDGSYKGKKYFKAFSNTSGSFLRENDLDFGTDLLDEINEKYASDLKMDEIKIKDSPDAKLFEFVKMEKTFQKQKQIFQLKCIVLSFSKVSHFNLEIAENLKFNLCTELDLCSTLIGKWTDLINILSAFPVLKTLHLDYNRIEHFEECTEEEIARIDQYLHVFRGIKQLSLNECLLTLQTVNHLPKLKNYLNEFTPNVDYLNNLKLLDLQGNPFKEFQKLESLFTLTNLECLNLSSCQFECIHFGDGLCAVFSNLKTLILNDNPIRETIRIYFLFIWESIDQLGRLPSLTKLSLRGTLLSGSRGVESREIVIAKLPKLNLDLLLFKKKNLIYLDKCDISPSSRQSAELLFFSRFSIHPICKEHLSALERLQSIYGLSDEINGKHSSTTKCQNSGIQSCRLFLVYGERSIMRSLSLALPLHKVVGLGARLFDFEPDQLKGVEIQRSKLSF